MISSWRFLLLFESWSIFLDIYPQKSAIQILPEAILVTNIFSAIFSNGSYVRDSLEFLSSNRRSRHDELLERTPIHRNRWKCSVYRTRISACETSVTKSMNLMSSSETRAMTHVCSIIMTLTVSFGML